MTVGIERVISGRLLTAHGDAVGSAKRVVVSIMLTERLWTLCLEWSTAEFISSFIHSIIH